MMVYRMLLGRQAIPRDGLVKPSASFLQPKLHYRVYDQPRRPALLSPLAGKGSG
jgi:hypothetical protein